MRLEGARGGPTVRTKLTEQEAQSLQGLGLVRNGNVITDPLELVLEAVRAKR